MHNCEGTFLAGVYHKLDIIFSRLNVHLSSIVASKPFQMPVEMLPRATYTQRTSRLSSFGYSGTIAHGAFAAKSSAASASTGVSKSLYRGWRSYTTSDVQYRMTLRSERPRQQVGSHLDEISSGVLSPSAESLFSDHVVGGQILHPGVGYLEMTFIANLGRVSAFTDVAFMRPCWLPRPGTNEKCVLRCTRRDEGPFEIASWRGTRTSVDYEFKTHFRATLKVAVTASSKQIPNRTHISWNVTNKMGAQNTNIPRMMPDVDFCGKVHASAMGVPMGRMAWFLSAREVLCNLSRQGARPLCSTGHVASIKRTLLLPARQQLCKPLCGSILSSRSPLLASQAWDKS